MWSYDIIITLAIATVIALAVIGLIDILTAAASVLYWAWEKIRILRRRDGQDV